VTASKLAEGALWRAQEAAEEDVRAECRSARSGVWLVARRRGALGTPRATLSWLSAEALAAGVPQRDSNGRLSRALRDPRDGTVRAGGGDPRAGGGAGAGGRGAARGASGGGTIARRPV